MQQTRKLEDPSWASGAYRAVRLQNLIAGKRLRRLSLYFDLSGTKSAADALDGDLFAQSVALIKLPHSEGLAYMLTGMDAWRMQHAENGRVIMDPTDIPGSGTTFTMQFQIDLTFRSERQPGADDGSLPTEMFSNSNLEITFASASVWGVGTLAVTAGNVRVEPEYVDGQGVPQISEVGYVDLASSMATIDSGAMATAILVQEDYSTITQAEIGMLGMSMDDVEVHSADTLHEQLVTLWNQDACTQSGSPHELAINAARFIPLAWLPRGSKGNILKQPAAERQGAIRITSGTLTAPRLLMRRVKLKTENQAAKLAAMTNAPGQHYEPATATKSVSRANHESQRQGAPTRKARLTHALLPGKMRTTPTPGSIANGK